MRIIVCGGRDYNSEWAVYHALDAAHKKVRIALLIEGGALGADRLARQWAIERGVPFVTENADWTKYGKAAGPIRNAAMLAKYKPCGVVAFPGGRGTADMVEQARSAGMQVWEPFPGIVPLAKPRS